MHQSLLTSHGLVPGAVLTMALLTAGPLAATPQGPLAPDSVTVLSGPYTNTTASVIGVDGPGCPDLVCFEENGGAGAPRGFYDVNSTAGTIGVRVTVGGTERLFGLATDPTGITFGVDPLADELYIVDLVSGATVLLSTLTGSTTVADITFDPLTGQLYGCERNAPLNLYTIDLGTGACTVVGTMSNVRSGLAFGPDGTLYGCSLNGALYTIDKNTAAETAIGGGGGPSLLEDAVVRADGTIFVTDFDGDVFSIDPVTGANTPIATSGLGNGMLGIVAEPAATLASVTVRVGTPPNPTALTYAGSMPLLGSTWTPNIDHTSFFPGAVIDALALSGTSLNATSPFGTILCNPDILLVAPAGGSFQVFVPASCAFSGLTFYSQGASTDGVTIQVTNALDGQIGMF